jgi:hypothetical protein
MNGGGILQVSISKLSPRYLQGISKSISSDRYLQEGMSKKVIQVNIAINRQAVPREITVADKLLLRRCPPVPGGRCVPSKAFPSYIWKFVSLRTEV